MLIDLLHLLRFLLLLGFGLLLPGWLLGRALGSRAGLAGALLGSAALLMNLVVLLDALGVPLDTARLSLALIVLCGGLAVLARRRARLDAMSHASEERPAGGWTPWSGWHIPALVGVAAIALRASVQPLSGYDCFFRWDFLAREMIHTGDLHFYPAISAADFQHYGWCDGIAPLVSSLYAWSYLSLGKTEPWATTPIVVAQGVALFYLVSRLASVRSGVAAGAVAAALLAASSVLVWGVAMGQETGLTALSTVAMFWFIERARGDGNPGWLVWAGIAAGTGALAREYGLVLFPLGGLALAWWKFPRRSWMKFGTAAGVVALPWYLRNWARTGNPLYCFSVGPLFPTNPIHVEWTQTLARLNGIMAHPGVILPLLAKLVILLAGVPLVIGAVAALTRWRTHGPWIVASIAFIALWLWSVAYTAGGYAYSLRVLTPAIALAAVLGGIGMARVSESRRGWILAVVLALVALDSAGRSFFLPAQAAWAWWQGHFPAEQKAPESRSPAAASTPDWAKIADAAEGRRILVTDPGVARMLLDSGAHPVSLFSPDVRFLFEPATGLTDGIGRLRAAGYRFIFVTRGNPFNDTFLAAHPFFVALASSPAVVTHPFYFIYDLYPPEQRRAETNAPAHAP